MNRASLLDTAWRPGIVLRPDGKPLMAGGDGGQYADLWKEQPRACDSREASGRSSKARAVEVAPVFVAHRGKR